MKPVCEKEFLEALAETGLLRYEYQDSLLGEVLWQLREGRTFFLFSDANVSFAAGQRLMAMGFDL